MKLSFLFKVILAFLVGLVVVFVIDPLDKSTVSTPFLLGILLMGFSLRQSLPLVLAVSLIYLVLTIYALVTFHHYYATNVHASPHPYFWLFQRSGLFIILCALSCYLAYYRTESERIVSRLESVLGKLPVPVVLSDVSGNILYANVAVSTLLHIHSEELPGKSYFNYFLSTELKGESIRAYFDLIERGTEKTCDLRIQPFGDEDKIRANLICISAGANRVLITVLETAEKATAHRA